MEYETKDSGEHAEFSSGMHRDTDKGKPRFDLCFISCLPYEEQPEYRYAMLRARGAEKYCESINDINCEKACSEEELARFRSSAARHFSQWMSGNRDEDHASAVRFNVEMAEMVEWKIANRACGGAEGDQMEVVPNDVLFDLPKPMEVRCIGQASTYSESFTVGGVYPVEEYDNDPDDSYWYRLFDSRGVLLWVDRDDFEVVDETD